ncbi:MAG TPA: MoaD/ThiS family protein [Firmicutes bacterium]|nr:MoaD/ThiS family protein [Bacillota bacterium]
MKAIVRLMGGLHALEPHGRNEVTVTAEGLTIQRVLERLSLPVNYVYLVLVNGGTAAIEHVLRDGDTVEVYPPICGG